jgi:hypothetical protein
MTVLDITSSLPIVDGAAVVEAVNEMMSQPHHVLVYQDDQEELAHVALQAMAKSLVQEMQDSNPSLDTMMVLDSLDAGGWEHVAPVLDVTPLSEMDASLFHPSQSIFAFGLTFMRSEVLRPFMKRANRFYAAIPDGPHVAELVSRVHPMRQVVLL